MHRAVCLALMHPGFINVLSWANESLLQDGRSQSDLRQGVTLEVMGEGESMGPLNDRMKQELVEAQGDIISFNSDAASLAPEGVFLKSNPHPRAYGNFARLLGKYVREEKLIPLEKVA